MVVVEPWAITSVYPNPKARTEAEALRELAGHDYNEADRLMVPLIVHLPGQKAGTRVATPVGQVDLVPTLADALDVDLSGVVHFGRSILRSGSSVISAGGLVGQGGYVDESVFVLTGSDGSSGARCSMWKRGRG